MSRLHSCRLQCPLYLCICILIYEGKVPSRCWAINAFRRTNCFSESCPLFYSNRLLLETPTVFGGDQYACENILLPIDTHFWKCKPLILQHPRYFGTKVTRHVCGRNRSSSRIAFIFQRFALSASVCSLRALEPREDDEFLEVNLCFLYH